MLQQISFQSPFVFDQRRDRGQNEKDDQVSKKLIRHRIVRLFRLRGKRRQAETAFRGVAPCEASGKRASRLDTVLGKQPFGFGDIGVALGRVGVFQKSRNVRRSFSDHGFVDIRILTVEPPAPAILHRPAFSVVIELGEKSCISSPRSKYSA